MEIKILMNKGSDRDGEGVYAYRILTNKAWTELLCDRAARSQSGRAAFFSTSILEGVG